MPKTLSTLAFMLASFAHSHSAAQTGTPVDLDLMVDGMAVRCTSSAPLALSALTGRLTASCDDGRTVDCHVAPWDWVLEPEAMRLTAICDQVAGEGLEITVTPTAQTVDPGGTALWQVKLKNNGPGGITSITVNTTPSTAGCARSFSSLAAGSQLSYSCALYNVAGNTSVQFVSTALRNGSPVNASTVVTVSTGSGGTPPGPGNTPYIRLDGCLTQVASTGQATWEVSITNAGAQPVQNVTVTDTQPSNCNRVLGTLAPGATQTFQCSATGAGPHNGMLKITGQNSAYQLAPTCPGCTSPGPAVLHLLTLGRDSVFGNGFEP